MMIMECRITEQLEKYGTGPGTTKKMMTLKMQTTVERMFAIHKKPELPRYPFLTSLSVN